MYNVLVNIKHLNSYIYIALYQFQIPFNLYHC